MTLLTEHPKVGPLLERARLTYKDGSKTSGMFFDDESIAALLAAILAAVGEGEGLDFDKAFEDAYGYPRHTSVLGAPKYEFPLNEAIQSQHRARVGALKQRIAELEAWKREVCGLVGESARAEEDWGKTLDRLCRVVTRKEAP